MNAQTYELKTSPIGGYELIATCEGKPEVIQWPQVSAQLRIFGVKDFQVTKIKVENGFLAIRKPDEGRHIKKFVGNLHILSTASAIFCPHLERVFGALELNHTGKKILPQLNSVGGSLYISSPASLPHLLLVNGSLTHVDLAEGGIAFPRLIGVGEHLRITGEGFDAPELRFVGGQVMKPINVNQRPEQSYFTAPQLAHTQMGRANAIDATLAFCKARNRSSEERITVLASLEASSSSDDQGLSL